MTGIRAIMLAAPVIPVLVVEDARDARPLAEALVTGGLRVLEVTLRTPEALAAIAEMAEVDGAIVGAGTVVEPGQVAGARDSGARFAVSPGLTEPVAEAVLSAGLPYLPGVSTAGDVMRGLALGLTHFKFFPAEASGGVAALRALAGPFGHCRWCPTGGITAASAPDWLALEPVLCVGGSWVVDRDLAEVTRRARAAADLRRGGEAAMARTGH